MRQTLHNCCDDAVNIILNNIKFDKDFFNFTKTCKRFNEKIFDRRLTDVYTIDTFFINYEKYKFSRLRFKINTKNLPKINEILMESDNSNKFVNFMHEVNLVKIFNLFNNKQNYSQNFVTELIVFNHLFCDIRLLNKMQKVFPNLKIIYTETKKGLLKRNINPINKLSWID